MDNIKYYDIPMIDTHVHVNQYKKISDTALFLKELMYDYNYDCFALCGLPFVQTRCKARDFLQNLKIFYCKYVLRPSCYALAGISHHLDTEKNTPEFYLEQAKFYDEAGFDGFKMIEGRINEYMVCGKTLDDPCYELFYDFIEARGFTIVMHVGYPEPFHKSGEITAKWPDAPSLCELYAQVYRILEKHPHLKLVLSHFYFISEHIDLAEKTLESGENVYFDLAPNIFMYRDFQKSPKEWTSFFTRHHNRILYGTDLGFADYPPEERFKDDLMYLVRRFFECNEPFEVFGERITPMPLDKEILMQIYRYNALNLLGKAPRAVNTEIMKKELCEVENFKLLLSSDDLENLAIIKGIFI